jgi:hypothetical protein
MLQRTLQILRLILSLNIVTGPEKIEKKKAFILGINSTKITPFFNQYIHVIVRQCRRSEKCNIFFLL